MPATLHNPGALVPVAEGLSSTWPELTALTSRESCGSPARGWDLVLPCIPRMTPNHCFAGDQRSGLHGDAEAARHWHGGGCRGRFRLPKSWSFPSHHKPHPQEPCWEPWAHEALPNGTRARPGSVDISHKRSPWSPQELSPFAGSTRDSEHPAPTPPLPAASPLTTGEKAICVHSHSETSTQVTTAGAEGFLPPPSLLKRGGGETSWQSIELAEKPGAARAGWEPRCHSLPFPSVCASADDSPQPLPAARNGNPKSPSDGAVWAEPPPSNRRARGFGGSAGEKRGVLPVPLNRDGARLLAAHPALSTATDEVCGRCKSYKSPARRTGRIYPPWPLNPGAGLGKRLPNGSAGGSPPAGLLPLLL